MPDAIGIIVFGPRMRYIKGYYLDHDQGAGRRLHGCHIHHRHYVRTYVVVVCQRQDGRIETLRTYHTIANIESDAHYIIFGSSRKQCELLMMGGDIIALQKSTRMQCLEVS